MFGVGLAEIAVIMVIAMVVAGPDRLPALAKQAAGLLKTVRQMADNARDDLRTELGPEYADLELRDLDPRTMVRKHLADVWETTSAEEKAEISPTTLALGERPPFDTEAT